MSNEKIVCAAIEVKYSMGGECAIGILCGVDYQSIRDNPIFSSLYDNNIYSEKHGFMTNSGRFVDPKEAMNIAINAGQLKVIIEKENEYFKCSQLEERQEVLDCIVSDILSLQNFYKDRDLTTEDLY
ncbi:hypothetical protein [Wohlfahrtiimonas larvae]|uniref:Uncharacterized protein n=1 Tax=Wohlfahrtiimonas larvae TaxID=1157986 RepID=A0ABP9MUD1_9GAMM|nr:hypothetical protein [Wohlfahrtiimonas larvae]